jgi:hypothetical protein
MEKSHTRESDELLLIQFVKDQGFDHQELIEAVQRLEGCHYKNLQDYSFPAKQNVKHDTHKTHCCILHGCKYNEVFCPVIVGDIDQEEICEDCEREGIKSLEELQDKRSKKIGTE